MGAGFAIAKTTQALGTLRHGQLLGKPRVRQVDDETVRVGFKAARSRTVAVLAKNLRLAKARRAACVARVRGDRMAMRA